MNQTAAYQFVLVMNYDSENGISTCLFIVYSGHGSISHLIPYQLSLCALLVFRTQQMRFGFILMLTLIKEDCY